MKKICLSTVLVLVIAIGNMAYGQSSFTKSFDLSIGVGKSEGTLSPSFNYDYKFGKRKRLVVGLGARFTSYLGKNQYYETAPAELTSGDTGPEVIFKENIVANIDSFLVKTAQINSLNLMITLGYNVTDRLMLRFNIDAIGFSFGQSTNGNYINGTQGSMAPASPTSFNLLLVSDNDKGTLNSELFARYLINERWGIKGGVQFLFTEYTTDTKVQQFPEPNDRFRNKSLMFGAGITYQLK